MNKTDVESDEHPRCNGPKSFVTNRVCEASFSNARDEWFAISSFAVEVEIVEPHCVVFKATVELDWKGICNANPPVVHVERAKLEEWASALRCQAFRARLQPGSDLMRFSVMGGAPIAGFLFVGSIIGFVFHPVHSQKSSERLRVRGLAQHSNCFSQEERQHVDGIEKFRGASDRVPGVISVNAPSQGV